MDRGNYDDDENKDMVIEKDDDCDNDNQRETMKITLTL